MKNKVTLICISFFLCTFLLSCTVTTNKVTLQSPPLPIIHHSEKSKVTESQTSQVLKKEGSITKTEDTAPHFEIFSNIKTSTDAFNPSLKEEVAISFDISQEAIVTLNVYDPDNGLIKTVEDRQGEKPGTHTLLWDGKDMDGEIVADEAYYFTLQATTKKGEKEIYDPTVFSGGIEHDITKVDIDRENHTINYRLPQMARVLIRIGIHSGPLLNTLVDWKPRITGAITEYFNGKDQDNLINLWDQPRFKMIVTYFTLPENSVITYGNKNINYIDYKKTREGNRPIKPQKARIIDPKKVSYHFNLLRINDYSPEVLMTFPQTSNTDPEGVPILKDKTIVRVELAEKDKKYFTEQQYEITFFLDTKFYAEEEVGYSPFNWTWDLTDVEPGDHTLTVNLSSFKDQIGVLSKKIKVVR